MSPRLWRSARGRTRKRGLHPLLISALTILAIAFVTYYAFNQGVPFVHRFTVHALVTDSVNVRASSPVRIAGIDIGSVQGVSAADGSRLSNITFTLDGNGLPIHTDATVRIRPRLFLEGGYYLELDPGSPSAPIAHDGYTIPPAQTSTPVQFYKVLSVFDAATRASLSNLTATLDQGFSPRAGEPVSNSGAGALKRAIAQQPAVLKDAAWVTRALRGTQLGDVERLLGSASNVTGTLAASSTQLTDLVTSLDRTSMALAAADGALAQSISGLDQTLLVTPAALSAIDRSLPPLTNLARALDPVLKVSAPIVDGIDHAVLQLAAIVAPSMR
jgi:phospholipid/cholesterol/gamma-HCH transport system substrate-binding protein